MTERKVTKTLTWEDVLKAAEAGENVFGDWVKDKSKCPCCGNYGNVEARRRNTCYADDIKNYKLSCYTCFKRDKEMLDEMWDEYRSSQGFGGL